ncbi:MAG: M42 family metallopeptidase [archaeon]|nr:M42 family metallopeptidase [archaeon]
MSELEMDLDLLAKLTNAFGPSGHESEVQKIVRDYGQQYADEVLYDRIGSVIFKRGNDSNVPKIMLAGHSDEIGFIISGIEATGYLKITNLGYWWEHSILNQELVINPFDSEKKIIGIIIAKLPSFFLTPEERTKIVKLKHMRVDIGCHSRAEVEELGIRVGDPAVPLALFRTMNRTVRVKGKSKENDTIIEKETTLAVAKAFDDRIGVFIALEVLRRLSKGNIQHPNTLYCVSTVQEEIGGRGARTASNLIEPDIGFALDVDVSGDLPEVKDIDQKMGSGVAISAGDASMIPNPKLRKYVIKVAEELKINWQTSFLNNGGTDAGIIHVTGIGAPSVFIGIPTRHIHTHHSMIDLDDVENAIKLMIEVIKRLDSKTIASFSKI